MNAPTADRCILFADVAGSTRMYDKLGDAEARRAVERCLKRVRLAVDAFGGRVVKTIGDALLAEFSTVDACVPAACQMQQRVHELPPVGGLPMAIRIGFHCGSVIEENGDVFGDAVNLAARMADIARGGQIIATGSAIALLPPLMRQGTREIDRVTVKGRSAPVEVCEVLWQNEGDLTLVETVPVRRLAEPVRIVLRLRHGERTLVPDEGWEVLSIGRDRYCDLVIEDKMASRLHARIERRGDRVLLVDQSTNGTWLQATTGDERQLRREEVELEAHGSLSFGHPRRTDRESVTYDIHRT
jgi:adenylate cyclase